MCISISDIGDAVSIVVVSNTNVDDIVGVITVDFDVVSILAVVVTDKTTLIHIRMYIRNTLVIIIIITIVYLIVRINTKKWCPTFYAFTTCLIIHLMWYVPIPNVDI